MIIGITGRAGAGKDTAADVLVKECGFVKVGLADPMKRAAMEWFDFSIEQLWGPSEMRNAKDLRYPRVGPDNSYLTPRHALQQLGTEFGRACYQDVWVDYAMRVAKRLAVGDYTYFPEHGVVPCRGYTEVPAPKGVVIPDVRFANELAAIRKAGGRVFRIEREGAGLTGAAGAHQSETEQNGFQDVETIRNDGTIEDLAIALRKAIESE